MKYIIFLLLFFSLSVDAQTEGKGFGIQLGYFYQSINRIDLGANYLWIKTKSQTRRGKNIESSFTYGPSLNAVIFFDNKNVHVGTSVGFNVEKDFGIGYTLEVGNSFEYYNVGDLRVCPQIGIGFLGALHLNYSYCIPLNNKSISGIGNHRVGLVVRFNRAHMTTILPMI